MKYINLIIFSLILVVIGAGIFYLINSSENCKTMKASEMNIHGHNDLVQHIHANLKISILGLDQPIPPNIGRDGDIMRPIHTHDTTGKLHIESYCLRDFKLGEFFEVWGKEFNEDCIFEHCSNDSNKLRMYVDNKENLEFGNLSLKDGDIIKIVYK